MTRLHKIVLGIETGDLAEELEAYLGLSLINKGDRRGRTPLMWAFMRDDLDAAEILLQNGADVIKRCRHGANILNCARSVEGLDLCLKYFPASLINSFSPASGITALLSINQQLTILPESDEDTDAKNFQFTSRLIDAGADVNLGSVSGNTPLRECAARNYPRTTKLLLDCGADVNKSCRKGITAIMEAIRERADASLSIILNEPGNIKFPLKNSHGWNFLHYLAWYGSYEILELFKTVDFSGMGADTGLKIADCKEGILGCTPEELAIYRFEDEKDMKRIPESRREEWWDSFIKLLNRIREQTRISLLDEISSGTSEEQEDIERTSDPEDSSDDEEFHDCYSDAHTSPQDAAEILI
ncbi:hypothetical protein TWF506_003676 [Arthrobotrys conoides]|uniref:Ankyrin n=1 Tax=Arthrobotrys conoides TaxID=74498 RepID=A0AAN8NBI3_9PEZI